MISLYFKGGEFVLIQRFIELGEGYSDLYELIEIGKANKERITFLLALNTKKKRKRCYNISCCSKTY